MILKVGKQLKCSRLNKRWYIEENIIQNILTIEFYSTIKKAGNPAIYDSMDKNGGHYAE